MAQPIITDQAFIRLLSTAKVVEEKWRTKLEDLRPSGDGFLRSRYVLPDEVTTGPTRGSFFLFRRQHPSPTRALTDFTIGLGFTDLQGWEYRLVRCNGAHGAHCNRVDGEWLPIIEHVHYMTEIYQRRLASKQEWSGDGFAVPLRLIATTTVPFDTSVR